MWMTHVSKSSSPGRIEEISFPFKDCAVSHAQDGNLSIEVNRKPTHIDQYLLFDSRHPLQHKLGVIQTLQEWDQKVSSSMEGQQKELTHMRTAPDMQLR